MEEDISGKIGNKLTTQHEKNTKIIRMQFLEGIFYSTSIKVKIQNNQKKNQLRDII